VEPLADSADQRRIDDQLVAPAVVDGCTGPALTHGAHGYPVDGSSDRIASRAGRGPTGGVTPGHVDVHAGGGRLSTRATITGGHLGIPVGGDFDGLPRVGFDRRVGSQSRVFVHDGDGGDRPAVAGAVVRPALCLGDGGQSGEESTHDHDGREEGHESTGQARRGDGVDDGHVGLLAYQCNADGGALAQAYP